MCVTVYEMPTGHILEMKWGGLTQNMVIPEWKWELTTTDFVVLPCTFEKI